MHSTKQVSLDCRTPDGLKVAKETENSLIDRLKFKTCNRPLCVVVVVGLTTLVAFIDLFVNLPWTTECETQSMTTGTPLVTTFFKEHDVTCMHWAVKVDVRDGQQEFPPCRMVNMSMSGEVTPLDMPICPNSEWEGYEEEMEYMDPCVGMWHEDGLYDPALMVIEFDVCPDPVLDLGSAWLALVAMIVLAITLVTVAVGMLLGCFDENDKSTLKTLIREMIAEEMTRPGASIEM